MMDINGSTINTQVQEGKQAYTRLVNLMPRSELQLLKNHHLFPKRSYKFNYLPISSSLSLLKKIINSNVPRIC